MAIGVAITTATGHCCCNSREPAGRCEDQTRVTPLDGDGGTADHGGVSITVQVRDVVIPPAELSWRFSRSPGPGGQSVNTADSRVELSYDLAASDALGPVVKERALRALAGRLVNGVITVTASEHRSQLRNRQAAASRLAALLVTATAPPPPRRRPTKPSRAARERRLAAKQRRSQVKRMRRINGE
jgi:ribosome-associated protein